MTTPDHPFAGLPPRFPQTDADAFLALFHGLNRSYVDAMALCLLLEMHAEMPEQPCIAASYRELARRSRGTFHYRVVGKSYDRLMQQGCIEVSEGRVRVNMGRVHDLTQIPPPPAPLDSAAILWGMALGSCWTDSVVLAYLVDQKAHQKPIRKSYQDITQPLALSDEGVLGARRRLTMAGILRANSKQPGQWTGWFLDLPTLQPIFLS
jgi:hypothetical protein